VWRSLQKLSEDIWNLKTNAKFDPLTQMFRIRSTVLQTGSCTGRLLFVNPDIQCIKKENYSFLSVRGIENNINIREAFIAQGQKRKEKKSNFETLILPNAIISGM
jgi:hypothetical protein